MINPNFENIPDELKKGTLARQWVNWKIIPRKEGGKPTKPPYMPSGNPARTDDPSTWSHFLTAQAAYKSAANHFDGVGIVLTQEAGIVAVDFDDCRCPGLDGVDAAISGGLDMVLPEIAAYVKSVDSYSEVSPSGKGIRIFAKGRLPVDGKRKGPIEIYQAGRYVTVTGHVLNGFPRTIEPRQMEIDAFYKQVFGASEKPPEQEKTVRTDSPPPDWQSLLEKAFQSKNGPEIQRLWNGDFSAYPSQSEGDLALCSHLAFWLGRDTAAMDAAFRESGLFRKKWDEKHGPCTYGDATIMKAVEGCETHFGEERHSQRGAAGTNEKPSPDDWPDPIPFNDYSLLPSFPVEAIPGVCGEMVAKVAESCQVDPGLPGCLMLAALSTAIGARVRVCLDSHSEQGNLYLLSVLGSGNRKSETVRQIAAPLYDYQKSRQDEMSSTIREAENRKQVLERRLEKLRKSAADTDDRVERDKLLWDCDELLREIEAHPVPPDPKYLVDNITLEKLGETMADHDEQLAILSPEGGIFKIIGGLYNSNGNTNIDLILKAHTGDPWSSERIGRGAQSMQLPALTLGLAVQPDVLEEIGRNSEFRGRGLSARFLYAWCQSKAGYRTLQSSPVPASVMDAYHRLILSLLAIDGRHELTITPEAQAIWKGFYADVELLLRPGADLEHLIDWGSKLPGAVARIAGLLHFAENGPEGIGKPISRDSVSKACYLGAYFKEHAKAAFGIMKEDARLAVARKILSYIKRQKPESFKGRDLFNYTSCESMGEIEPGLTVLIERGFIREAGKVDSGRRTGRPEAQAYEVNPKIHKQPKEGFADFADTLQEN